LKKLNQFTATSDETVKKWDTDEATILHSIKEIETKKAAIDKQIASATGGASEKDRLVKQLVSEYNHEMKKSHSYEDFHSTMKNYRTKIHDATKTIKDIKEVYNQIRSTLHDH